MNSSVERFGFGLTVFLTFVYPFLLVVAIVLVVILGGEGEGVDMAIGSMMLFTMLLYCIILPITYCILGVWVERIHFRALENAERELSGITVSDMKTLPSNWQVDKTFFVCENVVVSNDYLKRFFWTFSKIFGGRSRSYERLVERARREATVRLMRRAREYGANTVWNVRLETAIVYANSGNNDKSGSGVEVVAYGTAFHVV